MLFVSTHALSTNSDLQMRQRSGCGSHPDKQIISVSEFQCVSDGLPVYVRVEGRQMRPPTKALVSCCVPRERDAGSQKEEVTCVASRDEAKAAFVCGVRTVYLVLG